MTLAQALELRTGDHVTSRLTPKVLRVSEVWKSGSGQLVQIRCARYDADAWMDATAFELVATPARARRV